MGTRGKLTKYGNLRTGRFEVGWGCFERKAVRAIFCLSLTAYHRSSEPFFQRAALGQGIRLFLYWNKFQKHGLHEIISVFILFQCYKKSCVSLPNVLQNLEAPPPHFNPCAGLFVHSEIMNYMAFTSDDDLFQVWTTYVGYLLKKIDLRAELYWNLIFWLHYS